MLGDDNNWSGEPQPDERPYGAVVLVRRADPDGHDRYLVYAFPRLGLWRPPLAVRRNGETVEAAVRRELAHRLGGLTTEPILCEAGHSWQVWSATLTRDAEAILLRVEGRTWADQATAAELGCPAEIVKLLAPVWPAGLGEQRAAPLREFSSLNFRFTTIDGRRRYWPILVVSFSGRYGVGAEGNGDGEFMAAVVRMGRELLDPCGVVLDLLGLQYEWGDKMTRPFEVARVHGVDPAIAASSLCRGAMTSLLRAELGRRPSDLLCRNRADAIANIADRIGGGYAVALALNSPQIPTFEPDTVAATVRIPGARGEALREQIWAVRGTYPRPTPADLTIGRELLVAEAEAADSEQPGALNGQRLNRFLCHYEVAGLDTVVDICALAHGPRLLHVLHDLPTPLLGLFVDTLDRWIGRADQPARTAAMRAARGLFAAARESRAAQLAPLSDRG